MLGADGRGDDDGGKGKGVGGGRGGERQHVGRGRMCIMKICVYERG